MSESSVRVYADVMSGAPRVRYESRQKALRAPKVRGFKEYPIEEQAAPEEQRELPICPLSRQERIDRGIVCAEVIEIDKYGHFCKLLLHLPNGRTKKSEAFCMDSLQIGDFVDLQRFYSSDSKMRILGRTREEFVPGKE